MKYDIGIIGGGPAGYSAAFEASERGKKVILFEQDQLGGTCLNRGCIPTKYLLHAASLLRDIRKEEYILSDALLDAEKLHSGQMQVVDSLRNDLEKNLALNKIEVIKGNASVEKPGSIFCNNMEYPVEKILIATGIHQKSPFAEGFITSDELLQMHTVSKTMKIVGGGTIAVEFAFIYASLGAQVTLQVRSDRLLRTWTKEISRTAETILKQQGVTVMKKCSPEILAGRDAEICLSAVGMLPELTGINADLFDIGEDGGIITDSFGETKTSGIYAIGDVRSGSERLAHTAMEDGKRVVRALDQKKVAEKGATVRCIYLAPEIAEAGIDEGMASDKGIDAVSAKTPLYSNSMNVISGGYRSFIRLTGDKRHRTLIGAQVVSEHASDLIAELSLAINTGLPVDDLCGNIRPHPSFSEGVTEAVRGLEKALK